MNRCVGIRCLAVAASWAAVLLPGAEPARPEQVRAPTLQKLVVSRSIDLPGCDAVVACARRDSLIIRRGARLSELPLTGAGKEEPLGEDDTFRNRELVCAFSAGDRLFVLLNEDSGNPVEGRVPILFETTEKKITPVLLDAVVLPKGARWDTYGPDVSPLRGGMVLGLSYAGPSELHPRPAMRPEFLWIDLKTGAVRPLPARDYHYPLYTDATGRVMVFQKESVRPFERPPLIALDLETGRPAEVPDIRRTPCGAHAPWWEADRAARALVQKGAMGDTVYLKGVSVGGKAHPLAFPEALQYAGKVQVAGGWAGVFALHKSGEQFHDLWLAPLDGKQPPRRAASSVARFVTLGEGRCLAVTTEHQPRRGRTRYAGLVYDHAGNQSWDLLEGIDGLPPLKDDSPAYYHDALEITLAAAFGSTDEGRWALANCRHRRMDMRALVLPAEDRLPTLDWEKALLISSQGRRYEVDLRCPAQTVAGYFMHEKGTLVLQKRRELKGAARDPSDGRFGLSVLKLDLPKGK